MPIPTKTTPDSELLARLHIPYYNPRRRPMAIPTARWDESPCWCLSVNDQWASHILAALNILDQWDTWVGTDEEIDAARTQVNELIACFMEPTMGCGCNEPQTVTNRRVNADGTAEVSYDGGITWVQDPNDPRNQTIQMPPLVTDGGDKTKCDAASNGLQHLKDAEAAEKEEITNKTTLYALAVDIIVFVVGLMLGQAELIPFYLPIIVAAAQDAFSHTADDFDAMFTSDVWDATLCILYCRIGDNGQFDQAGYDAVIADCGTKIPGGSGDHSAAAHIRSWIKLGGVAGLNNICSYGSSSDADCSACGCDQCDLSGWITSFGNELSRTSTSITVQGVSQPDGNYYATIRANDVNNCCDHMGGEMTPNNPILVGYVPCGQANITSENFLYSYSGQSCNLYLVGSPNPFTMVFHSGA